MAFGKEAESFVKGEEKCASPAPVGSCISRLCEEGGKVLLIGVGHEINRFTYSGGCEIMYCRSTDRDKTDVGC